MSFNRSVGQLDLSASASNWRKLRKPKHSCMTVYYRLGSMVLIFTTATGGLR